MGFDDDEEEGLTQAPKGQDESAGEKTAELISEKIVKFQADVIQFEKLVGQLGSDKDSAEMRQKMEKLRGTMKLKTKDAADMLKKEDRNIPKAAKSKMVDELKSSTSKMQELLEKSAHLERENILKVRRKSSVKAAMDMNVNNDDIVLQMEESGDDVNAALVKERNAELKKVEEDMEGLAEVVSDLNSMVHEQGESLNVIEDNVNQTKENVSTAVVDLGSARSYQASARKKMFFLALGTIIGLAVGGFCIWYFGFKGK